MARAPQRLPATPLPTAQTLTLTGPKVGALLFPGRRQGFLAFRRLLCKQAELNIFIYTVMFCSE